MVASPCQVPYDYVMEALAQSQHSLQQEVETNPVTNTVPETSRNTSILEVFEVYLSLYKTCDDVLVIKIFDLSKTSGVCCIIM